jgi:hypothetical protein
MIGMISFGWTADHMGQDLSMARIGGVPLISAVSLFLLMRFRRVPAVTPIIGQPFFFSGAWPTGFRSGCQLTLMLFAKLSWGPWRRFFALPTVRLQ